MRRVLWGRTTSSNVMKVIWLLEELGLPYERIDAGLAYGRNDTPEYLGMNPTGLVPTLEEDGFSLWESNAILRYLCNALPDETPYYPRAPRARAGVDRWLDCQQTQGRPQTIVFQTLVRTPPANRDMAALAQAVTDAGRIWGFLEQRLAQHAFICGEAITIADIAWGVHVHRWFVLDIDRPALPHLRAWYERLLARPVYAQHIARPLV